MKPIISILGMGSDIVECLRIAKMIERHGELFLDRVFTPHEIEFCTNRAAATQHFSAHWAAKEATFKAISTTKRRGIGWLDIEVRHEQSKPPEIQTFGAARDRLKKMRITRLHLSMSHCRGYAVAHVIAQGALHVEI